MGPMTPNVNEFRCNKDVVTAFKFQLEALPPMAAGLAIATASDPQLNKLMPYTDKMVGQ